MGVIARQWQLWQGDKKRLVKIKAIPPLPPLESWPQLPKVSALVAAWNEANNIQALIESFISLRYPHKQLVLVAGGMDGTYKLAQRLASEHVVVIEQLPGEGKQRALRKGFPLTNGELIYLTDADCLLNDESLEKVLYPVACGQELAATGTSLPAGNEMHKPFVFSQAASHLYSSFQKPDHAAGILGCNCIVSKDALVRSEGLQVEAPSGTDYTIAKMITKAGVKIRQVPRSYVISEYPTSFGAYYHQQARWLNNVAKLGKKYEAWDEVRSAWLNSLTGLGMLLMPLIAITCGPFILAVWGVLMIYAWLSRIRYGIFTTELTRAQVKHSYWISIPYYLLLDFVVWAGSILRLLRKRGKWH